MSDERQEYNEVSPWWGEHVFRYNYVADKLTGQEIILDIACGSGFGTHKLSKATSAKVFGLDVSAEAIQISQQVFKAPNLQYKLGDASNLEFDSNYFDVITSFETIEHTTKYREMLKELKRVLKPGGTLFLSTPNKLVSSPDGIIVNPYHTQEFKPQEFFELIKSEFSSFDLLGQYYARYTGNNEKKHFARGLERLLYKRGVRKLPMGIQNTLMKTLIKRPMYPQANEFKLIDYTESLPYATLFAICKK